MCLEISSVFIANRNKIYKCLKEGKTREVIEFPHSFTFEIALELF